MRAAVYQALSEMRQGLRRITDTLEDCPAIIFKIFKIKRRKMKTRRFCGVDWRLESCEFENDRLGFRCVWVDSSGLGTIINYCKEELK